MPTRPQRFEPVPKADLVPPALPPRLQYMPRPRLDRFLLDTAFVMAAPIQPRISNAWVLGSAASGAVLSYIFDVEIHQGVRSIPDPELFGFQLSYWISEFGEGAVDVAIVSLLGIVGGKRGERVCIAGLQALLATAIVSRTFKLLLRLERPSDDQWNRRWFSGMRADAFPSGHTMAAFATAAVIAEEWPLSAPFVYTLATWVGISRVQQHTHWLTDVIIGGALGALFGWEAMRLTRRFEVGLTPWVGDGAGGVVIGGKTFY